MTENFIAVGADELGEPLADQVRCPNCKQRHPVKYGDRILREADGTERREPSKMLAFVKCPVNDAAYLVGIDGKELNNA